MSSTLDTRLAAAEAATLAEITRTDTKAGVLLTSFSLPLAALVATVPSADLPTLSAVLVGAGTVGLVAAMLVVLLVVRPRITGPAPSSFLHWATCSKDELLADLQSQDRRAEHVINLSQIARRKCWGLRLAGDITAAAFVVLAAALLAALLA